MKSPVVVAKAILYTNQKILLIKRSLSKKNLAGYRDLPGGKSESHETVEQTIIRETQEEIGYRIDNPVFLTSINNTTGTCIFHFFVVYLENTPNIRLSKEHTHHARITRDTIDPNLNTYRPTYRPMREKIPMILQHYGNPIREGAI